MKRFWATILTGTLIGVGTARADDPDIKPDKPDGFARTRLNRLVESPTWIGAMCGPTDPALQAQLGLKAHEGLVVLDVVADSPAVKAGLKKFDVVVKIDDKSVNSVIDLMDAVRDAGEKEMKLEIIRGGKRESLAVTPSKRPDGPRAWQPMPLPAAPFADGRNTEGLKRLQEQLEKMRDKLPEAEIKRLEQWIDQLEKGGGQPLRMNVFGPGVVMQRTQVGGSLPSGVSVSINKQGDGPTKIHVERGDEKWDITEKELDKLPKDLQGPIGAMLGQGNGAAFIVPGGGGGVAIGAATASGSDGNLQVEIKTDDGNQRQVIVAPAADDPARKQLAEEVERLNRQLEQLQKQVDELKGKK